MVLGKLPVPGRPTIWMIVGQWPIALAEGAAVFFFFFFLFFCFFFYIFTPLYLFSPLSSSIWVRVLE